MKPSRIIFLLLALFFIHFKPAEKLFVPPGTVKVNETLYCGKTEVSNKDWKAYQLWTKQTFGDASVQYKSSYPDTSVWFEFCDRTDKYAQNYFRDALYNDHPIVGITYEQAADFCKWRTEEAKELTKQKEYSKTLLPKSFIYRLPTGTEWQEAAKAGYSEKHQKYIDKNHLKPTRLHNIISDSIPPPGTIFKEYPDATITAPVDVYFPNSFGIFNLIGNVKEMTSTKGIAKGGGWGDRNKSITIEKEYSYEPPSAELGFRCVCEVTWK